MPTVIFLREVIKNASESRKCGSQAAAAPVRRAGSSCRPPAYEKHRERTGIGAAAGGGAGFFRRDLL